MKPSNDKLLKVGKLRLRLLLIALGMQFLLWAFLVTHVPVIKRQNTVPRFSFDPDRNGICMELAMSGSRFPGPGQTFSDMFCIDVDSGALTQITGEERPAESRKAQPKAGTRRLLRLDKDSFQIGTFEPGVGEVLSDIVMALPGNFASIVNNRYFINNDEAHIYVWDAEFPNGPVKSIPTPLDSPITFTAIPGTDRFYCVASGEPNRNREATAESSGSPNRRTQENDASKGEDPFAQATASSPPTSQSAGPSPFSNPSSFVRKKQEEQGVRLLRLFGVSSDGMPTLISSWKILAKPTSTSYSESAVAITEAEITTIAFDEKAIEVHSTVDGSLIRQQSLPDSIPLRAHKWNLSANRRFVNSNPDLLFDLTTNRVLPNPGADYGLEYEFLDQGLGLYRRQGNDSVWMVFDFRTGNPIVEVPIGIGLPLFMNERLFAICSAKNGFHVETFDRRTGQCLNTWAPWWWVSPLLTIAIVTYAVWSCFWLAHAVPLHQRPWLDVAIIGGLLIAAFVFRIQYQYLSRSMSLDGDGYNISVQSISGVLCAMLLMATCGIFAGKARFPSRLILFLLLLAGIGALFEFLLVFSVRREPFGNPLETKLVYESAWTALAWNVLTVSGVMVLCWLLLALGFRFGNQQGLTGVNDEATHQSKTHAKRSASWRILDLLMMTAACGALLVTFRPYAATAREDLQSLYGNYFFSENRRPLITTSILAATLMFGGLARHKTVFVLSSLVVAVMVIALVAEPVVEFALGEHPLGLERNLYVKFRRFTLTCAAASFILSLPYRRRGWRYTWSANPFRTWREGSVHSR